MADREERLEARLRELLNFQAESREEERNIRLWASSLAQTINQEKLPPARLFWLLGLELGLFRELPYLQ